jgi:phosphoesterase RecJ-like protein
MTQDISIAALLAIFRRLPHFVLTSHERPDGDAIGSVLALAEVLDQLGCSSEVVLAGPAPEMYSNLPNIDRIRFAIAPGSTPRGRARDGLAPVVVLECDSIERTGLRGLENRAIVNIDHHASGRNFGAINWVDPSACAVAAMVYRLALAAQVEITPSMATCLYTAILSDTGSFNYAGTTAEAFAIAHDLTLHGANPSQIARDLYHSNPASKVRILATALSTLQISGDFAWTWVTLNDLDRAEATPEDCEGIIGNLIGIEGIEAAFILREQLDGFFRLSLRSRGNINVALVAESFGGGGHKTASGCAIHGPLHMAVDRLLAALRSAGQLAAVPASASGSGL